MEISKKIIESISDKDGNILISPLLSHLNDVLPEQSVEYIKTILSYNKTKLSGDLNDTAQYVYDLHTGKEEMAPYCTGFHK